jgi:glycerophosphoryl diester phosphodiesterase
MSPLFCIAHRGGPAAGPEPLPENSLAAIARALDMGVDAIEIDIYANGDELLVTHDRRLGRVVSGEGLVDELPHSYLQQQSLANGEPIPRLQQVLELVGARALLNIEIKGTACMAPLAQLLQEFVREQQYSFEQYVISSFDHQQLFQALQLLPAVKRGVLIEGVPLDYAACCLPLQAYSLNNHLSYCSPELVADARRRGFKNWVYTVNRADEWQQLQALGVDAVFTDRPDALMAFTQDSQFGA